MTKCFFMNCEELPDPAGVPDVLGLLTEARAERIGRLRLAADRRRCLGAGLLLREVLPEYGLDPGALQAAGNGKPVAPGGGKQFNLSHAGAYALLAVSDGAVGCDIEEVRRGRGRIAERFFSEGECRRLAEAAGEERDEVFFRIWTARESYIKMTGEGLALDFRRFETEEAGERAPLVPASDFGRSETEEAGGREASGRLPGFRQIEQGGGCGDAASVFAPAFSVLREQKKEDCLIWQSLLDGRYVLSVCSEDDSQPSLAYRRALI